MVTGADGFIGGAFCRYLADSHQSFVGTIYPGHTMKSCYGSFGDTQIREIDLSNDSELIELIMSVRPSIIINFAAVGVSQKDGSRSSEFVDINIRMPGVLMEHMPDESVLIQIGSVAQYFAGSRRLSEEDSPISEDTLYAWSKNSAEKYLSIIAHRIGKRLICLRLFHTIGPGEADSRLLPQVVRACLQNRVLDLTHGRQVRDILHVTDVIRAIQCVIETNTLDGKIVNIGRGKGVTIRWIAKRAAKRLGKPELLRFGALPLRRGEFHKTIAKVSYLNKIGYAPLLSIEESVDQTVDNLASRMGID